MGGLMVLIGKSCAGKDAVCRELCENYGWQRIVTYTSRKPRKGEKDGVDYHFISQEEFEQKIANGEFLEYKQFSKADEGIVYYGSPLDEITSVSSNEKKIIILTPRGYKDLQTLVAPEERFCVYVYANNATILGRLKRRKSDTLEETKRRFEADNADFKGAEMLANKIVYNNDGTGSTLQEVAKHVNELAEQYFKDKEKNFVDDNNN